MARHKALLIGASDYDDPRITDLPFVRDDLQRLRECLIGRGFAQADVLENKRGITQNTVRGPVRRFLREADTGDTLLILLSGHGIHFKGQDYLVPEDATYETEPFADSCIPIDWDEEVEESPASRVVFLVDACREGMELDTKAPPGTRPWQPRKIIAALRRKVAYVYGCAQTSVSYFVRETDTVRPGVDLGTQAGESFSIFSRAMADVIAGDPHALGLREFFRQVQERVDQLHRGYDKPIAPQQIKLAFEAGASDGDDFPLLPGPDRQTGTHPWVRGVERHTIWQYTPEGTARDALRQICGTLAARLATAHATAVRALADDPWHDGELAGRCHDRLGFLVGRLADGVRLSPTEAALAVLFPLVTQTFWAQEAAQRKGVLTGDAASAGPDRHGFDKFGQGFPRLKRRLRTLKHRGATGDSAPHIRWWLFHRWLIQQPELYTAERLKSLLGDAPADPEYPVWAADAVSAERLARLLREHRTAPFTMRRTTTAPGSRAPHRHDDDHDVIAASTGDEHEVRTPLINALVKAAYAMAVDPLDLPEIVVEHIGVHDSVDLAALRTTVRRSNWLVSGLGRSLNTMCTHPAVQVALREHAARVDGLLRDINRGDLPALAPLHTLPPYADGSRVRLDGNTPDQLSDGIRFQLAEDRVQELLMGEELYGDSDLAVRELYQNALDALRYRDCRTQYLRRTGRTVAPWEGGIEFVQGVRPDGRPYLECRDNGIGMGLTELSTVFSQGGARFVDLPEYVEEQAAWAQLPDPKPELHPNSRFGIGVLSYFMLADEIVVRTCRMGRDGRPGRLLQVTIAGPGNFFRVEDLGEGEDAGTTVQLLLSKERRRVSCVNALNKVLWVAPYRTSASHGARQREWAPGELSMESLEAAPMSYRRGNSTVRVPSDNPNVWWLDGHGILLADGLFTETEYGKRLYGAVVNLTGDHAPRLTVDRKRARNYDKQHALELMTSAIASLSRPETGLLDPAWLEEASDWDLPFADRVAEQASEAGLDWPLGNDVTAPFAEVGFFPPDADLLPLLNGRYPEPDRMSVATFLITMPLPVLRWRLHALYGAGLDGEVSLPPSQDTDVACARPSDLTLVASRTVYPRWPSLRTLWLRGPWATARIAGDVPSEELIATGLTSLGGLCLWRDPSQPVGTAAVLQLSKVTRRPPVEIAERLTALGYRVDPLLGCAEAQVSDLPLLRPFDKQHGWLPPGATLAAWQVCVSAARARRGTPQAARRLEELGFRIPAGFPVRERWNEEELKVVDSLWSAYADPPSLEGAGHVSAAQLTAVARATDLSVRFVSEFLAQVGFGLPPHTASLPELTDDDKALLSHSYELKVDREVPLGYVTAVARHLNRPAPSLAARLRELGYTVADVPEGEAAPSREQAAMLRVDPGITHIGAPVDLMRVVRIAHEARISLMEAVAQVVRLGHSLAFAPEAVRPLKQHDVDCLYYGAVPYVEELGPIPPDTIRAVAHHTRQEYSATASSLSALGFDVVPPTEEWLQERRTEDLLVEKLGLPGQHPMPLGPGGPTVSLVTLAMAAMRAGTSLRTAALMATELGIRHEAEGWFTDGASAPAAPSGVAAPPG
ncbi:caspase family protein [Streptomyces sp. NRRL S-1022]|uniref:HD domain-containing protein n=1 Tax=Streptomyces sp. NRRL S-1022 TaxID=1463880 RepID=UPI0004C0ED36|nr:caspase family protein [Streptomyces sp. NRRL S-1022]